MISLLLLTPSPLLSPRVSPLPFLFLNCMFMHSHIIPGHFVTFHMDELKKAQFFLTPPLFLGLAHSSGQSKTSAQLNVSKTQESLHHKIYSLVTDTTPCTGKSLNLNHIVHMFDVMPYHSYLCCN